MKAAKTVQTPKKAPKNTIVEPKKERTTPQKTEQRLDRNKVVAVRVAIAKKGVMRCEITGKIELTNGALQRIHIKTFMKDSYGPLFIKAGEKLARLVEAEGLCKHEALARVHELPA